MNPGEFVLSPPETTPPDLRAAYPWVVKSLRQSRLLEEWLRQVRGAGSLPSLEDFEALRTYREQAELTIYEIVRSNASLRYRVAREGTAFRPLLGSAGEGRFLDEVMTPSVWKVSSINLGDCVSAGLPLYIAFSLHNEGQAAICERLMLPFGTGTEVTRIASSMKVTSWAKADGRTAAAIVPEGRDVEYSFRAIIPLPD